VGSAANGRGGLVVAGSYTARTTRQITVLCSDPTVASISLQAEAVLSENTRTAEIRRVIERADTALAQGKTTLVYTSRELVAAESQLEIGKQVSSALTTVVRGLETMPRYLIAKGGITSSDIATEALDIRRAWVLGQIEPGVPVWQLDATSRFPLLPLIVFPGNVGDDAMLARIVAQLQAP
jgi:uncharacterized protein YgbK (DUF1537 family)